MTKNSLGDGIIYFGYLDYLVREDVFTFVKKEDSLYKLKTTRLVCEVQPLDAKLTLVAAPNFIEGIIAREVYVEINSRGKKSLEEWERCLSALFSFLFSTHVSGSKIWPFERGKWIQNLPLVNDDLDEIRRAGREYSRIYRQMILELPTILSQWASKWFDHPARPLGIYKYLETIRGASSVIAEFQISLVSEAFVHYFGEKDSNSAESCIKRQYAKLSESAGVCLEDEVILKPIWQFYGNFKHFTKGNQNTSPVATTSGDERVRLLYLSQSLFQLSALFELLEDNVEKFKPVYQGLVKPHLILNKFYVL